MSTKPRVPITPEEYLALERKAEIKSEYFDGEMFAMAGAMREHNTLTVNIARELSLQLLDRPCEVYVGDMRTKVSETGLYTYPDAVVVCGEPEFEDDHFDTLLNPQIIFEILSESTESYDRGKKFAHYRAVDTLRDYILISQTEHRVERFSRQDDGNWLYSECADPNGSIELPSIACRISISRLYHKVDCERAKSRASQPGKTRQAR